LPAAEKQIDENNPSIVHLYYGPYLVGKISHRPEAEKLRGRHLRSILVSEHHKSLLKIMAFDTLLAAQPTKSGNKKVGVEAA
jgi:hypothetical protein